jgi:hypothetical protein
LVQQLAEAAVRPCLQLSQVFNAVVFLHCANLACFWSFTNCVFTHIGLIESLRGHRRSTKILRYPYHNLPLARPPKQLLSPIYPTSPIRLAIHPTQIALHHNILPLAQLPIIFEYGHLRGQQLLIHLQLHSAQLQKLELAHQVLLDEASRVGIPEPVGLFQLLCVLLDEALELSRVDVEREVVGVAADLLGVGLVFGFYAARACVF